MVGEKSQQTLFILGDESSGFFFFFFIFPSFLTNFLALWWELAPWIAPVKNDKTKIRSRFFTQK